MQKETDMQKEADEAVRVMRGGGIILYPTDTVWGLGCDATNAAAVERIYRLKRSENKKSMLVLCASADMTVRYVNKAPGVAFEVMELATSPLTAILPGAAGVAENLIPEEGTLGVRIPDHEFCRRISPASKNRSSRPRPTSRAKRRPWGCRTWRRRSSTAWISSSTPVSKANRPAKPRRSSRSAKAAR